MWWTFYVCTQYHQYNSEVDNFTRRTTQVRIVLGGGYWAQNGLVSEQYLWCLSLCPFPSMSFSLSLSLLTLCLRWLSLSLSLSLSLIYYYLCLLGETWTFSDFSNALFGYWLSSLIPSLPYSSPVIWYSFKLWLRQSFSDLFVFSLCFVLKETDWCVLNSYASCVSVFSYVKDRVQFVWIHW